MASEHIPRTFTGERTLPKLSELSLAARTFGPENEYIFATPSYDPGDVESFLHQAAPLFELTEKSWVAVESLVTTVKETVSGGLIATHDTLKDIVEWHHPHQGIRSERRRIGTAGANLGIGMLLIEGARERAVTHAAALSRLEDGEQTDSQSPQDNFHASTLELQLTQAQHAPHKARAKQKLPPDVTKATQSLFRAYTRAFMSQGLAVHRLETLIQEEANVEPFVERLHEVIGLRKAGVNEFPGLLETVNTHIAHTADSGGASNILHQKYEQSTKDAYSLAHFTKRLFSNPSARAEGQVPKEFQTMLLGARLVARAIKAGLGEHHRLDDEKVAEAVIEELGGDHVGELWLRAYHADSTARQQASWRRVWDDLKKYNRRGRLPKTSKRVRPAQDVAVRHRRGRSLAEGMPTQAQVEDIVLASEQTTISLGVLRGLGDAGNFCVDEVASFDALLEHDIVTNFVRNSRNAATASTIQAYLSQLIEEPTNSLTTKTLEQYFKIDGNRYRLRRYRPRGIEGTAADKRIRIVYGLVPRVGSSILALHDIRLRESTTY